MSAGEFNVWAFISLLIKLGGLSVIVFYVIPKQFAEVLRPYNWLTGLRWQILGLFIFSVVSAIPSMTYQMLRSFGNIEADFLRNIASITGNISDLGITILLVLIYNYKQKD